MIPSSLVARGVIGLLFGLFILTLGESTEYRELESKGLPVGAFSCVEVYGDRIWVGLEGQPETDPLTGQVFRGHSFVYRSKDGGETWGSYEFSDRGPIGKIVFLNEDLGFLLSETQIYRTRDGGDTWMQLGTFWEYAARDLQVVDELTQYVLFESSLFVSKDGGDHWERSQVLANSHSIAFTSDLVGFYGGHGFFYKTQDGGISWELVETPFGPTELFSDIVFVTSSLGFVATHSGQVMRTSDGGLTWTSEDLVGDFSNVAQLDFSSATHGVALFGNLIFETKDAGLVWEQVGDFGAENLLGIAQGSDETIVAGALGHLDSKEFNSDTWRRHYLGFRPGGAMSFIDALNGWVLDGGWLYRTADGGAGWDPVVLPGSSNETIEFFEVFADGSGIAFGLEGSVWHRSSESGDWSGRQNGFDERLVDISFLNTERGWVMDEASRLFGTSDGGGTWTELGSHENKGELEFLNESVGWFYQWPYFEETQTGFLTRPARLRFTQDGGVTWEDRLPGIGGQLAEVRWQGDRSVLLVESRVILDGGTYRTKKHYWRSLDLGRTWTELVSDFALGDYLLEFTGECVGYALGDGIYETSDGGVSWSSVVAEGFELRGAYGTLNSVGGGGFVHIDQVGVFRHFELADAELSLKGVFRKSFQSLDPFAIRFESEAGKDYIVESSSDLRHWLRRCDRIVASDSETLWVDEQVYLIGLEAPARFYRVYEVVD